MSQNGSANRVTRTDDKQPRCLEMNDVVRLLDVIARLRSRESGCPWDRQQTFETIAPYTIEEAYEVADAIERGEMEELAEELGDLLFQVVFHAQMAKEADLFDFTDVVDRIVDKMIRRHPHVFGDESVETVEAQSEAWEAHKAAERRAKHSNCSGSSLMDGITRGLPALKRALKLQHRAAQVGFDWPCPRRVLDQLQDELHEARTAMDDATSPDAIEDELGDLMFTCVNFARHVHADPEAALREANTKFERRFRRMEAKLAEQGRAVADLGPSELDPLWEEVKREGL